MAVDEMAEHQVGRNIPKQEIKQIASFLRTLSGEILVTP